MSSNMRITPKIQFANSNYYPHERTNGRTNGHQNFLSHGWKKSFAQLLVFVIILLFYTKQTRYTVRGRGAKRRTSSILTRTYLTCLWSKTTCIRLTAYARLRHIDENFQEVPYQGGSGGSLFCKHLAKRAPNGGRKRAPEQADTRC